MRIRHLDPSQSRFTKSSGFRRSHHMGFKSDLQFSHSCFALHYGAASAHFLNGIEGMREDDARRKGGRPLMLLDASFGCLTNIISAES